MAPTGEARRSAGRISIKAVFDWPLALPVRVEESKQQQIAIRRRLGTLGIVIASVLCFAASSVPLSGQTKPQAEISSEPAAGKQLFSTTCAGCHGLDGRGGERAAKIATSLSDSDLTHFIRNGIRSGGMPAFGSSLDDSQISALVKYLRVLQGQAGTVSLPGDPERGRMLFFGTAGCSGCHMINGAGGFLGADLSNYGKAHSPAEIRESIIDPQKSIDPRNAMVIAVTRTGKKYTGVVRNEDNFSLQMQTADGSFHLFDKSELARIEHQAKSMMPSEYGSRLSKTDLDDLVSYLTKIRTDPDLIPADHQPR